ncbi:peptidoglycan DD-metalloendopeptidase Csd1 [Arcobacter sp. 15-2]|uniref:peptidoglycan DD-metalloendopeptidase family protein n=1 Tax=Arcobacter sp. 15-2 TaxID=3374109 RepID=UPI00399C6A58
MKIILSLILAFTLHFASTVQEEVWWKGETLLTFFDKHNIPQDIYFNLSKTDKELCSEIYAGVLFQMMFNENHKLTQALIPISEEMQIHLFKDEKDKFTLDIIPIEFQKVRQAITIPIKNSPYQDIVETTGNKALANEFIIAFKKSVNFRRLRKDDLVSIVYTQKIRMGRYFGTPEILGASVQIRKKTYYIFENPDDKRYYNDQAKSLTSFMLRTPLRYNRISSKFTLKRFHPILKRYRAHLGVDFAAPTGRRVNATADGKIIHKGRKGGYGKTVMIRHKNGLKSLYAHLNSYNNKIRVGSYVKQGQFIGRVGTTGRSTGPHLHFGLYKNGRAVDPLKIISVTKTKLVGKKRKDFLKTVSAIKKELKDSLNNKIMKIEKFEMAYKI